MLINKIWVYVRIFSYSRRWSAGIGQSRGGVLPLRSVRDMKVMMGHRPFPLGSPNTHWSAMIFIKLRLLPYGWTRLDQPPLSSSPQLNWIVHLFPLCHLLLYRDYQYSYFVMICTNTWVLYCVESIGVFKMIRADGYQGQKKKWHSTWRNKSWKERDDEISTLSLAPVHRPVVGLHFFHLLCVCGRCFHISLVSIQAALGLDLSQCRPYPLWWHLSWKVYTL